MSNNNLFSTDKLKQLLEPFVPGMFNNINPIMFEALNPSCLLFLFRSRAEDGSYRYYVSLETDKQNSLEGARCTIEDWHDNEFMSFIPVIDKNAKPQSDEIMDFQSPTNDGMIAMLAEVKKPTHKGYWADALEIMPGDNIEDKIKEYPEKVQANIRKVLSEVLKNNIDPNDLLP